MTYPYFKKLVVVSIITFAVFLIGVEFTSVQAETPIPVEIDIKPGNENNCINIDANGVIPVAVLTTDTFDASTVDAFSIELASAPVQVRGKSSNAGSLVDIDSDGDIDLLVHIVNELCLVEGEDTATLTGNTTNGTPIEGTDLLCIIKNVNDKNPPTAVTDFVASNNTTSSIDFTWTAPGDDGNCGTATSYDIRYSTSLITEENWSSATQATGEPTLSVAGTTESFTISGLAAETIYYVAIKTSDEVPNESALSNVVGTQTLCLTSVGSGGEQVFIVSSSNEPRITKLIFNPLDVIFGGTQLVTVEVKDNNGNPITSVEAAAIIDNSTTPFSLSLVSGTDVEGTWQGTWMLQGTNCSIYQVSIDATSASGTSNVTPSFR